MTQLFNFKTPECKRSYRRYEQDADKGKQYNYAPEDMR